MWKMIKGYEGVYEVSDHGEIRRVGGFILKMQDDTHGYLYVSLSKNSIVKNIKVHRLVAAAFLDNPTNLNVINHLDGNKMNNSPENLEWTTTAGNNQHAWDTGLNHNTEKQRLSAVISGREAIKIAQEKHKKKILCLDNGIVYDSLVEAAHILGVDHSKITLVASGKRSHTHGYHFAFVDEGAK
jgi:hypothetical protein